MKKILILCAVSCCAIIGCGGADGLLNTSMVSSSVDTLVLDSDVVTWVDASNAKATACASTSLPATPIADVVNVTVTSKAYSNTGSTGLPIRVKMVTISYAPANSSTPAMPPEYQAVDELILNGGTKTMPVRVVTQEQKQRLQPALACNTTIYNYYTKITIDVEEVGSSKTLPVEASMQLRLADFVDK